MCIRLEKNKPETTFEFPKMQKVMPRLVGHFAYCATPLSLTSFKLSKTFNYQPLFFHSPTQNENVKKVKKFLEPAMFCHLAVLI